MTWMDVLPFRATRFWTPAAATPEGRIVAGLALPETVNAITPALQLQALADKLTAMSEVSEDPRTAKLLIVEMLERMRLTDEVSWTETALASPIQAVVKGNQQLYANLQETGLVPSGASEMSSLTAEMKADLANWTVEIWVDALSEVTERQAEAA